MVSVDYYYPPQGSNRPITRRSACPPHPRPDTRRQALALTITGAAVFMVTLDNLVVTNALPSIRADLGATISQLGWFVNAYTLTFAALLLTGASLGDRFGRRRVFATGLAVFTAGSLWAALATSSGMLIAARGVAGPRRRARHAAQPDAALGGVPGRAARPRDRHLVRSQRPRRRARAGRRRRRRGRALVAVDLLPQRADRHRARAARLSLPRREPRPGRRPRRARPRAREHRPVRARVGHRARQRRGLAVARDRARRSASAWRCSGRSSPGSAARRPRCCRCTCSAAARSAPRTASRCS